MVYTILMSRLAEVAREHGWPPPKSLDSDENFKPEHTLFCREIKICRDLRTLWKSSGKKSAFLGKKSGITVNTLTLDTYKNTDLH